VNGAGAATRATQDEVVLAAEEVSKRYGARTALAPTTLRIGPGELVALIGPNGAGKTTLLSILAGATPATGGRVSRPPSEVGWVPQEPSVYRKLTVAENLRLFARLEKVPDPEVVVERMLDQTGLRERADDEVGRLSGGNRQRVNVAVGVLAGPAILLLDEPTASLDPRQRERLWEFLGGLVRDGTGVLFSTHEVSEAARYASRVLVLADGALLFDGTPDELGRRVGGGDDLEAAFIALLAQEGH